MGTREEAVRLHGEGFNCAQCVFCACGKYTGLDDKSALAIAGGFGGGLRCGEICGAISGAVMAIGALRCLDLKRAGVPCDDLIAFGAETAERLIGKIEE